MNSELRWRAALLQRVVLNAILASLAGAVIGIICGVMMGMVADWFFNGANVALKLRPTPYDDPHLMTKTGFAAGLLAGALISALLIGIAAFKAKPGPILEPFKSLIARVSVGQLVGAVGFCSLFLAVEMVRDTTVSHSFYVQATSDSGWLLGGTPVLMLFGAIAGALSKRGTR